jgi:hypothetical protein
MPIKVSVELTEELDDLNVFDRYGGDRLLYPNKKGVLGPFEIAADGSSSPPLGRLRLLYSKGGKEYDRIFDVHEGLNLLPPHGDFASFARFVLERGKAVPDAKNPG